MHYLLARTSVCICPILPVDHTRKASGRLLNSHGNFSSAVTIIVVGTRDGPEPASIPLIGAEVRRRVVALLQAQSGIVPENALLILSLCPKHMRQS